MIFVWLLTQKIMNTISAILVVAQDAAKVSISNGMNSAVWDIIGAVIGFLLFGYLAYVVLKPEKF
jgi:K+-transporting ATPase KdpF subunit